MQKDIHPNYTETTFKCACGNTIKTKSTVEGDVVTVDVCSNCHPFYNNQQKRIEKGGRISRFKERLAASSK